MLNDEELVLLYKDKESDRVERKASINDLKKISETICAFSNNLPNHQKPSVIFIGQNDDLTCSNLTITDKLLLTLSDIQSAGNILPLPSFTVQELTINECKLIVLVVQPSLRTPVRYKGTTHVRVGSRNTIASADDERRLTEKQVWNNLPFDSRPFPPATIDDLNLKLFELEFVPAATSIEIRRENGRSTTEKLHALRLITPEGKPTAAAILLIGKDPRYFFSGAYIQFLRINGTKLTDPIAIQKEISGTLPEQVRLIEETLNLNTVVGAIIGGPKRIEPADYPIEALEQLVRNAILHRVYQDSSTPIRIYWYEDRIEIMSPGGLYGGVTPENIWNGFTAYRNPAIAEGLKMMEIIERFGYGLYKVKLFLEKNNNPPLKIEFFDNYILATVRKAP
jgi:ATP-dependent DNA helicase RecG